VSAERAASAAAPEQPDDEMVRMVSIQKCADFAAFMDVMNEDTPTLAKRGILGRSIYRAVDDPDEIMVTMYFRSRAHAEDFLLHGDELTRWLERAKVSIYPAVFIGKQIERIVCRDPEDEAGGVTSS
jgi:hypothetical protein